MTRNLTREDRIRGGENHWENYCTCGAPLLPGESCEFCEKFDEWEANGP